MRMNIQRLMRGVTRHVIEMNEMNLIVSSPSEALSDTFSSPIGSTHSLDSRRSTLRSLFLMPLLVMLSALNAQARVGVGDVMGVEELIERSIREPHRDHPALRNAPIYRIDVELDLDLWVYRARMRLEYVNRERDTLKTLNFLLYPNSNELSGPSERRLIITDASADGIPASYDPLAREVLEINLPNPLAPGDKIRLDLGFKGSLFQLAPQRSPDEMKLEDILQTLVHRHGPQGGYGVFSHGDGIASMALWYPILVAYDERGWDVKPSESIGDRSYFDVAHYDVSLTVDAGAAVATTGVESERRRTSGQVYTRYAAAGVREFSIQASRDYTQVSEQFNDVTVRSFVTRRYAENNHPALREAISALESFEAIYGPYPYQELEIAESPLVGGAGGVEFPGLITIGSSIYGAATLGTQSARGLYPTRGVRGRRGRDQGQTRGQVRGQVRGQKRDFTITREFMQESRDFVIAHEVAHQWWNAVVGSDSRLHPFVDEALANYSAAAHFARTRGPISTQRQLDMMMRLNYHLARLTGMDDQPVDQPTSAFEGLLDYGAIVYGKGALFFWELREQLGVKELHRLLGDYYTAHMFRVATGPALREALHRTSSKPVLVQRLTRRWLDERHGDDDIEGVSLYRTIKILLGDIGLAQLPPEMRRWLNHRGVDALADLVERSIKAGRLETEHIDYPAITALLSDIMSDDPEVARWVGVVTRALNDPNARPSDVLRDAGRELRRDDRRAGLILESAGLLLDAIMYEDERATRGSTRESNRGAARDSGGQRPKAPRRGTRD